MEGGFLAHHRRDEQRVDGGAAGRVGELGPPADGIQHFPERARHTARLGSREREEVAPQDPQRQVIARLADIARREGVEELRVAEGAPGHVRHLLVGERLEPDRAQCRNPRVAGIALERSRKGVVHEFKAPLLLRPLEHREINHPEELEFIGIEEVLLFRHVQSQRAENLGRRFVLPSGEQQ